MAKSLQQLKDEIENGFRHLEFDSETLKAISECDDYVPSDIAQYVKDGTGFPVSTWGEAAKGLLQLMKDDAEDDAAIA